MPVHYCVHISSPLLNVLFFIDVFRHCYLSYFQNIKSHHAIKFSNHYFMLISDLCCVCYITAHHHLNTLIINYKANSKGPAYAILSIILILSFQIKILSIPYEAFFIHKITVLYTLIFLLLDSKWEDKTVWSEWCFYFKYFWKECLLKVNEFSLLGRDTAVLDKWFLVFLLDAENHLPSNMSHPRKLESSLCCVFLHSLLSFYNTLGYFNLWNLLQQQCTCHKLQIYL